MFICPDCNQEFSRKDYLKKHLERQKACKYYAPIIDDDGLFGCRSCFKKYKIRRSLRKHFKTCIKLKERKLDEPAKSVSVKQKLENIKTEFDYNDAGLANSGAINTANNNTHNTNTDSNNTNTDSNNNTNSNNTTININIEKVSISDLLQPFDKSNNNILTKRDLVRAIRKDGPRAILQLLRHVHFNLDYPQFHNVMIKSNDEAMTYDGDSWGTEDVFKIVNLLISHLFDSLEPVIDTVKPRFPGRRNTKKTIDEYYNESDNGMLFRKVKDEVKKYSFLPKIAMKKQMDEFKKASEELYAKFA